MSHDKKRMTYPDTSQDTDAIQWSISVNSQQEKTTHVTEPEGTQKEASHAARLFYIDNLRVVLTVLVIMHHLADTYGAAGSWYYQDPAQDLNTTIILTVLTTTNQAFFMGLFFFISAYFTPISYDRKGARSFLKDRLLRLGIPLAIYELILDPTVRYIAKGIQQPYWSFWGNYLLNLRVIGDGPPWFIEVLLVFACLYALWRWLTPGPVIKQEKEGSMPGSWAVLAVIIGVGLVSFVLRIWLPTSQYFQPLNIQPAYFPQYIVLSILGIIAYRRNWLSRIPEAMGRLWLWVAIIAIILLPIIGLSGGAVQHFDYFQGGIHWQALFEALWEECAGLGLCITLLVYFRKYSNRQGALSKFLVANAYTTYIIHPVIIVSLAVAFQGVHLYPLLKYGILVLISVPLCFVVSQGIRQIPYARRIL